MDILDSLFLFSFARLIETSTKDSLKDVKSEVLDNLPIQESTYTDSTGKKQIIQSSTLNFFWVFSLACLSQEFRYYM